MGLADFWFFVIAVLWTGFFVLEGFDFGVGMLFGVVGRTDAERRVAINSIGPVWDGNEVWLIVAGAGMFSAFPGWYATMFSAFYLPLVLLLVALIVRGLSFEYRGKHGGARWRRVWDWLRVGGSLLAPLLIGVALGGLPSGVPIGSDHEYAGNFADLLTPYGLYVGCLLVLLCALHGAVFLTMKTDGEVRRRSEELARRLAPIGALAMLAFVIWTLAAMDNRVIAVVIEVAAVLAAGGVLWFVRAGSSGRAFALTAVTLAGVVLTIFIDLYPHVMVSSTNSAYDLTVGNTSSASYALTVMTIVLAVLLPVVLVYQGWSYYVFRSRITVDDLEQQEAEQDAPQVETPTGD
ncbi:cytochrome d ubiquinol oxidase subunit II [Actinomadura barringtoniae]|uniref:Cytochrome d ubiquinol oxidase subunit II n=1 Tax=Actinomadura barringtoniae TaxID=1427535 RepID=A0A939T7G2_9ACTN|nr:cytochrome d ubiquinol oxidase subunit II [Actinomadura barringtoniae]MBO2453083.1 cytochrome d ubiquinol oxidase subunit II [Actinomadura barringtoniae]